MVSRVDDRDDLGDRIPDRDLDALAERDIDLGAALAAASEGDIGRAVPDFEQVDDTAVRRDARVHLAVEDILDAPGERVAPALVGVVDPDGAAEGGHVQVHGRATQRIDARKIDEHRRARGLDGDVARRHVGRGDQSEIVGESGPPLARDRDPEP